ncbi:MAG TPA: 4-alpha-glucanotransferase [Candidatus Baltobacteraceae bacterium]|nr:4-alpha-glucanotransferase [Candidatus Baltobacteraceae bacterium]
MESPLDRLLAYARIDVEYADAFGKATRTTREGRVGILRALGYDAWDDASAQRALDDTLERDRERDLAPVYVVPQDDLARLPGAVRESLDPGIELGYWDVETAAGRTRVIVTPRAAYVPDAFGSPRWGYAAQLYSVRSQRNWGIGDFSDLARLATIARAEGASVLALNPLHQGHLTNPASASPYAPLSRRFLNALYIDVDAAAERCGVAIDRPDLEGLRRSPLIDYRGVAFVKMQALEAIFAAGTRRDVLRAFAQRDPGLRAMACYEAIMEREVARDAEVYGWMQWPQELRDCHSPAVAAFAREHARRLEFFIFLQWLADEQLAQAARAASAMEIGLYRDLAVGVDLASVDVWADPDAYALGLSVGAPPDPLNADGQNWGLPPFHPQRLAERAYEPFVTLLRANMRHAGALRIDHIMGLKRLFCVAREHPQAGGAYVNFDFEAMLGIVALESRRHDCMVVGEDLGTVPDGFRERIGSARIFACRVLYFERENDGAFCAPEAYAREAVASTGTHDLPTLAGFWAQADPQTRERLLEALRRARVLAEVANPSDLTLTELLVATYRYLGRSRSDLVLVQLEDALGSHDQVNVPGTVDEQPNWQRKVSEPLESLEQHPIFAAIARTMRDERPLNERGN